MPIDTSIALGVQNPQIQTINPLSIYQMVQDQQTNALRAQIYQQEMVKNAMAMQNTAEDRRIAAASRAEAARAAAEEKARYNYFVNAIKGGYTSGKDVVMGPGTVQGSTPGSFDERRVLDTLHKYGDPKLLTAFSNMQEQFGKQREAEGKATGQELTNKGLDLKNIDSRLSTIKSLAPLIDTPDGAAAFSKLVTQIVPEFAPVVGDPNAAAARNADAFTKDPEAWRTKVSNLTAEQLVQAHERATKAAQPEPLAVSRGATIIDKNPNSPTYGQPVFTGQANTTEIPELKKGEVWNPKEQRVEAAPGSDIYIQQSAKHGKDYGALNDLGTTTEFTTKTIDKILDPKNKSGFEGNFGGYNAAFATQYSPGQTQDVKADIETLKSQLKTTGLKLIRQGGSIGAMTEKEWPIVQNMLDTITPYMSEDKARETLREIQARVQAIRDSAADTYQTTWGNSQYYKPEIGKKGGGSATAAPDAKSVFDAADAILGGK